MTQIKWEVIADFPASTVNIGDIIVTNQAMRAYVVQLDETYGTITGDVDLSDYPHLFKRLEPIDLQHL